MTRPTPATSTLSIMDRAQSFSGKTYMTLLAVQGVAECMIENNLRVVKVTFHSGGELVTLEVKR